MSGPLALAAFLALAPACAPSVDAGTLAAVVAAESAFHPYAVAVNENGRTASSRRFATAEEATIYAEGLIARGVTNFDAGAAQINWRAGHLQRRGLPPAAAFDPCVAARVGSEVLAECWDRAPTVLAEQGRLDAALSCYNTGGFTAGLANGYVARVRVNFERRVTVLHGSAKRPG